MIIFDLDMTLANCEHRRHFVDSSKLGTKEDYEKWLQPFLESKTCPSWSPDWKSFYEACDQDLPIYPVIKLFEVLWENRTGDGDVVLWSGRCESFRNKTEEWLHKNINFGNTWPYLKMRPIGDYTPDEHLKEKWLDEALAEGNTIDFVIDDRAKVCRMWQRRGIFVFDVSQGKGDF